MGKLAFSAAKSVTIHGCPRLDRGRGKFTCQRPKARPGTTGISHSTHISSLSCGSSETEASLEATSAHVGGVSRE